MKALVFFARGLFVLYPFYVWYAVSHWHPAAALLPLILAGLVKSVTSKQSHPGAKYFFVLTTVLLCVALSMGQSEKALLFYPVWMSLGMLLLFLSSLFFPPTVIERIARLMEGDLDVKAVAYTRKVTQVWCGFFLINAGIASWTAMQGNWDLWVWYNGAISYALMGLLMLIEWRVRLSVKAQS